MLMLGMLKTQGEQGNPAIGFFCAVAAFVMLIYTIDNYRNGFMFCGRSERVYRKDNPKKFRLWLGLQILGVVMLVVVSVLNFLA